MRSQPKQPSVAQRPAPRPEASQHREPKLAHDDFVRMAKIEAEHRAQERHDMVATAAYFRAQKRGFEPGHELEDWIAAEAEVAHARQLELIASGAETH
nr:DUF2934 domain-containing protein [uncultured Steroidobacter sp.]